MLNRLLKTLYKAQISYPQYSAVCLFDISRPVIYQWVKKKKAGSLKDKPPKRPWRKINPQEVIAFVGKYSDLTLADYAKHFGIKCIFYV